RPFRNEIGISNQRSIVGGDHVGAALGAEVARRGETRGRRVAGSVVGVAEAGGAGDAVALTAGTIGSNGTTGAAGGALGGGSLAVASCAGCAASSGTDGPCVMRRSANQPPAIETARPSATTIGAAERFELERPASVRSRETGDAVRALASWAVGASPGAD